MTQKTSMGIQKEFNQSHDNHHLTQLLLPYYSWTNITHQSYLKSNNWTFHHTIVKYPEILCKEREKPKSDIDTHLETNEDNLPKDTKKRI